MSSVGHGRHQFVIGPLLGAGTFGEVYLARMKSVHGIEQEVAVKLLNPGVDPRSQPVSRMRDEGRMLAGLNHPAILQVMDFCNLENRIGLVTEFVPGADLDTCIHDLEARIPPRAAMQVIGAVADALHAAFGSKTTDGGALGLVHRDIKPANIRVTPHGSVKLLDFGIAKSEDLHRETATQHKMAFGTPAYMAPEVLSYEVLEALPSRDIFALGCTLFEALIGERYFEGLDHKTIGRVSNRETRFSEWRSSRMLELVDHDPLVVELLSSMLAFDHTQRPTAKKVAEACFEVADSLRGASLWSWARDQKWPEAAASSGPWTGRTVVDSQAALADAPDASKEVDPSGRVAAIAATGEFFANDDGGKVPPPMQMPVASAAGSAAAAPPTAHTPHETGTDEGTSLLSTLALPLAAVGVLFVVGVSVMIAGFVALQPDVVGSLFGGSGDGEAPILTPVGQPRAAGGGRARDTGSALTIAAGGAPAFIWGGRAGAGGVLSTIIVEGNLPVRLERVGERAQRLPARATVRMPPGDYEVFAQMPGARRYDWQLDGQIGPGDTIRIRCNDFGCKRYR